VPSSKVIKRATANFLAILSRLRMSVAPFVFHEETKERHPRAKFDLRDTLCEQSFGIDAGCISSNNKKK